MRKVRCVIDVETFSRVFLYLYIQTQVSIHICNVHHCEAFR